MISLEEAAAVERFALNSTIPIIYDHDDDAGLLGTGTLFKIGGHSLVVTAGHLFDDKRLDLSNLAYPLTPIKSELFTFGDLELYRPDIPSIDIAVLDLKSENTISRLNSGWQFLSIENVAPPSNQGTFFLSGYPAQHTKNIGSWLSGRFAIVYTERIPHIPDSAAKPVDATLDLFFTYGKEAETLDGKTITTPELPGTSGGSVWEYKVPQEALWTAERSVKVVGVQSAYIHSEYFRANSWWAVARVIVKADSHLSDELTNMLQTNI